MSTSWNRTLAAFFARVVLGFMFVMHGSYKVFALGSLEHARKLFVEPYADTFLPVWSLWATGTVVPLIEFTAGALMVIGFRVREAAFGLAGVLILVTFGHGLTEPFYDFSTHVFPRAVLLLAMLWMREDDRWSLDRAIQARRA